VRQQGLTIRSVKAALVALPLFVSACGRPAPSGGVLQNASIIGESGGAPGQFGYPRCLDSDASTLWVIDKLARVQRIDPASGRAVSWFTMPKYDNGKPTGLTVWESTSSSAPGPVVLIPDTHEFRVMIYQAVSRPAGTQGQLPAEEPPPALLGSFGEYGMGPGQFVFLTDVAVLATPDGRAIRRIYVSEYGGNDRISIFDVDPPWEPEAAPSSVPTTKFVKSFGRFGSGVGNDPVELSRPQSITIDTRRQELIVADSCNHRVGRFSLEGELLAWYGGESGAAPGTFSYPYGLTMLGDGSLLVAEFGNNRVQRIDLATGDSLGTFGTRGRGVGQLTTPWGVASIGDTTFILDSGNSRIQAISTPRGRARLASTATSSGAHSEGGTP
jgi:DNA-binding beta-propeller fold protein YncE